MSARRSVRPSHGRDRALVVGRQQRAADGQAPLGSRRRLLAAAALLPLTGCVSVTVGADKNELVALRLDDSATTPPVPRARPLDRTLVIAVVAGGSAGDSTAFAFSRHPGERAAYQFSTWADRPAPRVAQLLLERLDALRLFRSVALLGTGVQGDLLLNLSVQEIVHDVEREPGVARIELAASLQDRATRTLLARKRVQASAPVGAANARAASQAMGRALAQAFDELVPWIEASAARTA